MTRHLLGILSLALLAPRFACAQTPPRERISIDRDWLFIKGDPPDAGDGLHYDRVRTALLATRDDFLRPFPSGGPVAGNPSPPTVSYAEAAFDDGAWRKLDLPHDWAIEGPFNADYPAATARLAFWGVGWYRKRLSLSDSDLRGRVYLDVDGAMAYAEVWLNGRFVGGWPYGYASFELDLTPFAIPGENVLAIRLYNPPDSSRFYSGSGIYRNVWLMKTSPVHVAHWGTTVTTPEISGGEAGVQIATTVENDSDRDVSLSVRADIYALGQGGERVGAPVASADTLALTLRARDCEPLLQRARVEHPRLWNLANCQRYAAVTTIESKGAVLDSFETPFGIRSLVFDPDRGLLLNGDVVKFKGVGMHHDLGALGAAFNTRALERRLEMLKEMGCNAIRTTHNPAAPELLDLCDRMGFLVMDESFDCWAAAKRPGDYHLLFPDWHEADERAEVRRDRNHPCVVMWSIGNEIREQRLPGAGTKIGYELARIVHEEDPTRPVTAACDYLESGYDGFEDFLDVFGYNYKPTQYPGFHDAHPGKFLYGSETAATHSSRGEYAFPFSDDKSAGLMTGNRPQISSYDLYSNPHATLPDTEWEAQDRDPYVGGEFVWAGIDYLGEPQPFDKVRNHARSNYDGIIDLAGFKKDRFYLYQSRWRPDLPRAHILPHWNWPDRDGKVTPVEVYTSGDEAALYLNGHLLGRKKKGPYEYRLCWDHVVYRPGELHVIAYKDGKQWAEDTVVTTGPATKLLMRADRAVIAGDGRDLSFVTVTVADSNGLMVPTACNHVKFSIDGPAEIAAVDDGDPTSFEPFHASEHDAFNGLALVIVRSRADAEGKATLRAESDGLASVSIPIETRR